MLPNKKATHIAHRFVAARPHLLDNTLTEVDRAAVAKIARNNGIPVDALMGEVEAEIDWLSHGVPA